MTSIRQKVAAALAAVAVLLLAGAVLLLAAAWTLGGRLSEPAPAVIGSAPDWLAASEVQFASESGSVLHGWLSTGQPGKGALLLLQGVLGNRRDMLARAEFLRREGYSVLLIDLQAHGESPGDHISFGYLESRDAAAALKWLHARFPDEKLGAIGVSLGAASLVLAERHPPLSAVVLESMYPTIEDALDDRLRLHFGGAGRLLAPLLRWQLHHRLGVPTDALRPIDHMAALRCPVLLIAGTRDEHTTPVESRRLFEAAPEPKSLWLIDGAGHVNLHQFAGPEYKKRILDFLAGRLSGAQSLPIRSRALSNGPEASTSVPTRPSPKRGMLV